MAKHLYLKLATNNLKRNKRMYLPYFIASSVMVAAFFMVMTIVYSRSIANLEYGDTILMVFQWCVAVMTIVIVPFIFYINSFIIKERKKEFGLYAILGLEKGHVGKVICLESLMLNGATLCVGILSGCLLGKFIFMLMLKAFQAVAKGSAFSISPKAFGITILTFVVVFLLTTGYNLLQVQLANPISLLKGKEKGEKKVRFVIPLTIIGLGIMGYCYYKALSSVSGSAAVNTFFGASIGVMFGTYLLFIAGSVFFLRLLKGNNKFYYKAENFITIGSMFHRMRQNAAGLATICILSTMVIVSLGITVSTYLGQDEIVNKMEPYDITMFCPVGIDETERNALDHLIEETASANQVGIEKKVSYAYLKTDQILQKDVFEPLAGRTITSEMYDNGLTTVHIITLAEYNAVMGIPETLQGNEVLFVTNDQAKNQKSFVTGGQSYMVKKTIRDSSFTKGKNSDFDKLTVLVTADEGTAAALYKLMEPKEPAEMQHITYLNLEGSSENALAFYKDLWAVGNEKSYLADLNSIEDTRFSAYGIYGGLLFVGFFFSIVFLCAAIMIIYFKQVSEGFDDQQRFQILRKVGMSEKEIKSTINRQILTVFYLPLVVALVHVAVALRVINNMLSMMLLENTMLTLCCVLGTALIFALIYVVVYRLTAKAYYAIVSP